MKSEPGFTNDERQQAIVMIVVCSALLSGILVGGAIPKERVFDAIGASIASATGGQVCGKKEVDRRVVPDKYR